MTSSRRVIEPRTPTLNAARYPDLPLSAAVRAGDFVFLSGMAATDPETGDRLNGTVAAETRQILTNMAPLLEAAGSSLARSSRSTC
jgi:2-iminobutanoate/2-iminopropanoate deaminase